MSKFFRKQMLGSMKTYRCQGVTDLALIEKISAPLIKRDPDLGVQRAPGTPQSSAAAQFPYALLNSD